MATRDHVPGWRASVAAIGIMVAITLGVVLGGLALSVVMWLLAP